MDTIVVLPDWQVPLHDEQKIKSVAHFVWDFQPTKLAHVGDMTDSTQLGRWVRGLRGEFSGGLEFGFQRTRELIEYYRQGYDGPWDLVRSNHDERLELAIEQRLPGLAGITVGGKVLSIETALRLEEYGIQFHHTPPTIAPGWKLMHGDEGGSSNIPGNTALRLAQSAWMNVVCGHSHRAGLAWTSVGVGKDRRAVCGMEVGNAMDSYQAEYLGRARFNNWGNAFGILWIDRRNKKKATVHPQLVPVHPDGSFQVNGERYR